MNRTRILLVVAVASLVAVPAIARAADYHHVHLTTSNATEAVKWYERYLDCQPLADRGDAVDCSGARVVFDSRPTLGTSQRTGIDHIAFSYADLTAKMAELEAVGVRGSGVRLQRFEDGSTLRDAPGLFKYGFIFDPWGTRIEMVEDADTLGFHHIHLSATDPTATLAWYQEMFGGESARLRDRLDGVLLGDIWLLAMRHQDGTPAATAGRAIDHIAFSVDNLDSAAARMRRDGIEFLEGPAVPEGGRTAGRSHSPDDPPGRRVDGRCPRGPATAGRGARGPQFLGPVYHAEPGADARRLQHRLPDRAGARPCRHAGRDGA